MTSMTSIIRQTPAGVQLLSVGVACVLGLLLVASTGASLSVAAQAFVQGAFGSSYAISVSLNRSVIFALIGLGFILAERAGLTNVGAEGQIAVGGIAATAVALYGGATSLPWPLSFVYPMLIAALAGGLWGAIAGILKVKVGTNEVISTLLLGFIAVWLVYWSVQSTALLRQPMSNSATLPESLQIAPETQIPLLTGSYAAPVTIGVVIVIILAVLVWIGLGRTAFGFQLRLVGENPTAALRAGVPVGADIILALSLAGAFGGLAGALMLQGDQYSLKAGFSSNYGFDGLVVGLLARRRVSGVIAGALLFGFLRSGGMMMEMAASVPSAIVEIVQGLIVLFVAASAFWIKRKPL